MSRARGSAALSLLLGVAAAYVPSAPARVPRVVSTREPSVALIVAGTPCANALIQVQMHSPDPEDPVWLQYPRGRHEDEAAARERTMQAARDRMRANMGDEALRRGAGEMFGYGAADDEDYGLGPTAEELGYDEIDLLTGIPVPQGMVRKGSGFGGLNDGWSRRAEIVNPSGPRPANTLLAPDPLAKPAQAYIYEHMYESTGDAQDEPLPISADDSMRENARPKKVSRRSRYRPPA